jgi:predicted short-subunit dehydrogenase-like oxidoreductase (DUF2520 family)
MIPAFPALASASRSRSVALECAAEPTPSVFVVGAGAMGASLARALVRAGVPVLGLHGRGNTSKASALSGALVSTGEYPALLAEADVVIVAVRDTHIPEVAGALAARSRLRTRQVILHTAGSRAAHDVLGPARAAVAGVGTLHPLVSLTGAPGTEDNLEGAAFALEGDEAARALGKRLVGLMGGQVLALPPELMALYHAGAVFASNYVVALVDVARGLLVSAGLDDQQAQTALWPLLASVVRNLAAVGLPAALTGPVVRGDVGSVERHVEALAKGAPHELELYQRLGREVLRLARARSDGPADEIAARLAGVLR